MAKVTSELQVTIPKRIGEQHGIAPGDTIEFESMGDHIRIVLPGKRAGSDLSVAERLRLFDEATEPARRRAAELRLPFEAPAERDRTREELYARGAPA